MAHKLLLADDSITIQRVIELTFSGEDIEVVAVGDGDQAIARIPEDRPDIVLADIGMPRRNGYEVAEFVKDHPDLSHIPVLLLAGAFEPVDEARAKQVRCDGVLVKPFEPQHVIARVRELLKRDEPSRSAAASPAPDLAGLPAAGEDSRGVSPFFPPGTAGGAHGQREGGLDDYFDRLDAAFATLGGPPGGRGHAGAEDEEPRAVPTLDQIIGTPAGAGVSAAPAAPAVQPVATIADAFDALLAVEQGEPGAVPPILGVAAEPPINDVLVDHVARRVLQQLAPTTARDVVVPIVSEIAERLVREEIARVRATARA